MFFADSSYVEEIDSTLNSLLIEKTDEHIQLVNQINYSRAPYSENFQVFLNTDILSTDPLSEQVIIRQQYHFEWLDRPWGVDEKIESAILKDT